MFTLLWLKDALERAAKTAAQTVLSVTGLGAVGVDAFALDWTDVLKLAATAAVASVLTSVVSASRDGITPASLIDRPDE